MTADRASLGTLGFIFGGITAAVMLVAGMVVIGHLDGHWALEAAPAAKTAQVAVVALR